VREVDLSELSGYALELGGIELYRALVDQLGDVLPVGLRLERPPRGGERRATVRLQRDAALVSGGAAGALVDERAGERRGIAAILPAAGGEEQHRQARGHAALTPADGAASGAERRLYNGSA